MIPCLLQKTSTASNNCQISEHLHIKSQTLSWCSSSCSPEVEGWGRATASASSSWHCRVSCPSARQVWSPHLSGSWLRSSSSWGSPLPLRSPPRSSTHCTGPGLKSIWHGPVSKDHTLYVRYWNTVSKHVNCLSEMSTARQWAYPNRAAHFFRDKLECLNTMSVLNFRYNLTIQGFGLEQAH